MIYTLVDFDLDKALGRAIEEIEHVYFCDDAIVDFSEMKVLAISDATGLKAYVGYHDEHGAIYTIATVPAAIRQGYGRALVGMLFDMYPTVSWRVNLPKEIEVPGPSLFPHQVGKTFFKAMGFVFESDDCQTQDLVTFIMHPLSMPPIPSIWEATKRRAVNLYRLGAMLLNKCCKRKHCNPAKTKTS